MSQFTTLNTNRKLSPDQLVTTKELPEFLATAWNAGLVPCIHSAPGMGKSQIVRQAAEMVGLPLYVSRVAQKDPTSVAGMPFPNRETGTVDWMPDSNFPLDYAAVMFFDELNRAPALTQNGCFGIIDDRKVGTKAIHADSVLVIAVNDVEDGGGVVKMPKALENRLFHIFLTPEPRAWQSWAVDAGLDPMVIGWIGANPNALYQYDRDEFAWASPRTVEMLSKMVQQTPPEGMKLRLYAGCVGRKLALDFLAFERMFGRVPDLNSIRLNPTTIPVPTDPAIRFATAYYMASNMDDRSAKPFLTYVERWNSEECGVFMVKLAEKRCPALGTNADVTNWKNRHVDAF